MNDREGCSSRKASIGCQSTQDLQTVQPFPDGGRLGENLGLSLPQLRARIGQLKDKAFSYVVRTVRLNHQTLTFEQHGSAPNFQGDLLTLCTCKHQMRASQTAHEWQDVWLVGVTSRSIHEDKHWLFCLAKIESAYESHLDLWTKMSTGSRDAKAAHVHFLGDVFKPKTPLPTAEARFSPSRYVSPRFHAHRWQDEGGWHNDRIRDTLGLDMDWAEQCRDWEGAVGRLRDAIERIGVLVSITGVVGLNNTRKLDPEEFRGFVLSDRYAPLIFVNGADSKSAQMFTLAHELAHVWIDKDGLFNLVNTLTANNNAEKFCNQVAAEFLVPADKLTARWEEARTSSNPFRQISRWFKVSPVVAARRTYDLNLIDSAQFFAFYRKDQEEWQERKLKEKKERKGGPSFYAVQDIRLGRRFAYAVVCAAREGRLLYGDAYRLTHLKGDTFNQYADLLLQRMKDERR